MLERSVSTFQEVVTIYIAFFSIDTTFVPALARFYAIPMMLVSCLQLFCKKIHHTSTKRKVALNIDLASNETSMYGKIVPFLPLLNILTHIDPHIDS